jgi:hypothetical protein
VILIKMIEEGIKNLAEEEETEMITTTMDEAKEE